MRTEVKSSLLKSVAYNRATRELEIEFRPKSADEPGKVYRYADVDLITYEKFINAPSIGRAFLNEIKPAHYCTRVKEEKEDASNQESVPKAPDGGEVPF